MLFKDFWVAQSVKGPTLDFSSGYDLMGSLVQAPHGTLLIAQSLLGILCLLLSLLLPCWCTHSLKNKSLQCKRNIRLFAVPYYIQLTHSFIQHIH